jgi:hypothetical protein
MIESGFGFRRYYSTRTALTFPGRKGGSKFVVPLRVEGHRLGFINYVFPIPPLDFRS